jgi:hypothetical protein
MNKDSTVIEGMKKLLSSLIGAEQTSSVSQSMANRQVSEKLKQIKIKENSERK